MAKTISARKAKGRRCAAEVRELMLRIGKLREDDVFVTSSGDTGPDLKLSAAAKVVFPIAVECKNTERIDIWGSLKQSESHAEGTLLDPALFFKRNNSKLYVCVDAELFLHLLASEGNHETPQNAA